MFSLFTVKDLRNNGSGRTISTAPHPQDMLSGSLQVCRLALPIHRSHTTPASFESEGQILGLIVLENRKNMVCAR